VQRLNDLRRGAFVILLSGVASRGVTSLALPLPSAFFDNDRDSRRPLAGTFDATTGTTAPRLHFFRLFAHFWQRIAPGTIRHSGLLAITAQRSHCGYKVN
jgi:hypothetical protein